MPVNSHVFGGDPCPGTRKYVEVHYTCVDADGFADDEDDPTATKPPLPPWLQNTAEIWNDEGEEDSAGDEDDDADSTPVRKPILVAIAPSPPPPVVRIPITTPKPRVTPANRPSNSAAAAVHSQGGDAASLDDANHLERGKDRISLDRSFVLSFR